MVLTVWGIKSFTVDLLDTPKDFEGALKGLQWDFKGLQKAVKGFKEALKGL